MLYSPECYLSLELSTYFRINNQDSGQFERTLLVADVNSKVSYLEGCTAPQFDTNQLHAAIVELVALKMQRLSILLYKIGMQEMK